MAWDGAHKLEADGLLRRGWNPDTVEALLAVRRINDRVYKVMRDGVEQMLAKDYGEDVEEDAEDSVDPDDEELDIRILDTDDSTEE